MYTYWLQTRNDLASYSLIKVKFWDVLAYVYVVLSILCTEEITAAADTRCLHIHYLLFLEHADHTAMLSDLF